MRFLLNACVMLILAMLGSNAPAHPPQIERGDRAGWWKYGCVIYAEVMVPPHRVEVSGANHQSATVNRIVLRPIGTVSGEFDSSRFPELSADMYPPTDLIFDGFKPVNVEPTSKGYMVLAAVYDDADIGPARHTIVEYVTFMRKTGLSLEVVDGFRDPQVAATLKAIQGVRKGEEGRTLTHAHRYFSQTWGKYETAPDGVARERQANPYWSTRAVVYAEITQAAEVGGKPAWEPPSVSLSLRPMLTLAGAFDAGKTPDISAEVPHSFLSEKPAAGDMVLAVLDRIGGSYRIAQEHPSYMPESRRGHTPVCFVIGMTDPRVEQTVKALKELRKKDPKGKPKFAEGT